MDAMIQTLATAPSTLPTDASALDASISALKSSISALESSIKTLEGSSGCWETLAWLCAFAVGVGIVGEIVVIVCEYREDRDDWRRGIVRPPDHPPVWRFWFDIIATLLVLAGVFGEAGASMELASINSELRSRTDQLRGMSDQLLGLLTLEAEHERLERVRLQEQVAWRYLSPQDKKTLCAVISPALAPKVEVLSHSQDPEEWRYAQDFWAALQDCAKQKLGLGVGIAGSSQQYGVWIITGAKSNVNFSIRDRKAVASLLMRALNRSTIVVDGIEAFRRQNPGDETSNGFIDLWVGPRKPPNVEETKDKAP